MFYSFKTSKNPRNTFRNCPNSQKNRIKLLNYIIQIKVPKNKTKSQKNYKNGGIIYRLGFRIFIPASGVRLPVSLPNLQFKKQKLKKQKLKIQIYKIFRKSDLKK